MNSRQKGLSYVKEVRGILEAMKEEVEGPAFKSCFVGGHRSDVHYDYYGIFDLISWDGYAYKFHQVSDLHNKSVHLKAIKAKRMPGWMWCRVEDPIGYRIFKVDVAGNVLETGMQFIPKAAK